MKKIIAMLLTMAILISGTVVAAFAYTPGKDDGQIDAGEIFGITYLYFDNADITVEETANVDLKIKNNTGFTELLVKISADDGITLKSFVPAEGISVASTDDGYKLTADEAVTGNGTIATLTFEAAADAEGKKDVKVTFTGKNGDDALTTGEKVCVLTVKGAGPLVKGDVNDDGTVDAKDLAILKKKIAGLLDDDDESVVWPNVDEDAEGNVDAKDLAVLKKIVAGL